MRYRPEIDGLRAVSVLSVFLFHLGAKVASGGYVGVDVFFVISGYLITSLIRSERQHGDFSLISFYMRRIKRIAPALLIVVLTTVAVGYFVLPPGAYMLLARSGLFTIGGASNFFFFDNTGYFDPHADDMPLLHTWSLGVEEQFYVVWPGLLIILASLSQRTKIPVVFLISGIAAASLAAFFFIPSVAAFSFFHTTGERYAFYMPYTRAWELGLGAIITFLPEIADQRLAHCKKILPWAGLALIGAAVCQFGSSVELTGNRIVAATVGACFIIIAIEPKTSLHRILSSMPLVFVGKISYSLYLWHFPVIVFWRYYSGEQTILPAYFWSFYHKRNRARLAVLALHRGTVSPDHTRLAAGSSGICWHGVDGRLRMLGGCCDAWCTGKNPRLSKTAALVGRNVGMAVSELAFAREP